MHLYSTRLHQSAMNDADDPMSLFTSILKDIRQQTSSKISDLQKRFKNIESFKHQTTKANLNVYCIGRVRIADIYPTQ